ncbi:unnamed protein product [Bemisia tabaci]|uniref:alpha-1,2-Mannosidase n=1 Tax=Bemisia tabaci TaxID=7038 RepID=A0A9P0A598_BEMTA|nr:PREDICTED: endoplasmic reticulum mannosyl-oligosaccharide 1,2-alpha-mannosidase [Bemisia tabaci]CAH0384494.1 unnamed protein product [Bemisia tabaci]
MFQDSKRDSVYFNIDHIVHSTGEQQHLLQRRKLLRSWRQLTRLQKNLMCFVMVVGVLMLAFWILVRGLFSDITRNELTFIDPNSGPLPNNAPSPEKLIDQLVVEEPSVNKRIDTIVNVKDQYEEPQKEEEEEDNKLDSYADAAAKDGLKENGKQKSLHLKEPETVEKPKTVAKGPVVFAPADNPRQKSVIKAFLHAWHGYKKFAWGHDHLKPISGGKDNWFGLGLSIVDSLDTMYIMNLKDEFQEARDWVDKHLDLNNLNDVNLFEVTIRVLGGLLTAYHFSDDPIFLDKSMELGDHLLPCFSKSPSGIPYSDVNLASRIPHSPRWSPDSSTSEVTTVQLEFRDLSRSTKLPIFEKYAANTSKIVHGLKKMDGLVPIFINPVTGKFLANSEIKLGARGDSYYEYLLKQWIQTGKTIDYLRDDYLEAIDGVSKHLVRYTGIHKWLFIGELKSGSREFFPKMDHLVCYLPGTLALGVHHGLPQHHLDLANGLLQTCYQMYALQPTFLSPEIAYFNTDATGKPDLYVLPNDAHNLLRPEFLESLFYMYQITGNTTYQDWAWNIFQAFEKYTKVANGYSSIGNVLDPQNTKPRDKMESFFLSETLKYLYLILSSDRRLLDIDKYVINSEGHPLPIYDS